MSETKHTPGPWVVENGYVRQANGCDIPKTPADLTLAAAAPELLEALRFIHSHAFEAKWSGDERAPDLVEAAIAKAEGRASPGPGKEGT